MTASPDLLVELDRNSAALERADPADLPAVTALLESRTALLNRVAAAETASGDRALLSLERAREAAGDLDIRVGGGVATVRQYLQAGLVDEMHLAIAPVLLGGGENLLGGIDLLKLGYKVTERTSTPGATHIVLTK